MLRTRRQLWPRRLLLLALLAVAFLITFDAVGFGPNLGLPFGYYGQLNRIQARVEASPELEVIRVDLHRDLTLEDFFITVRTPTDGLVLLRFQDASVRPYDALLQELDRVGL